MEWIIAVVVALALSAFVFWPRVSEKIDDVEEAVQNALDNLPTKAQLMKLTKAKIDELAAEVGIKLDRRQTKEKMVAELQKQAKQAKK